MSDVTLPIGASTTESGSLKRAISWKGAFWVASGVPALVLFSIGGISGMVGNLAFLIWTASIFMGFVQSFTYAEIAGLFPNKSGGASVYGAAAWVRYSKFIAPLSVWCNWLAWTPVLSLGCSIAASYILNAIGSTKLTNWTLFAHTLGPVSFSFGSTFFIGAIIMLVVFSIQHRGILGTASVQKYVGLLVIIPMAIVGVIPLFNGHVHYATSFTPLVPLASVGAPALGSWNVSGWTLVLGAMFIAAWSSYGFETAVCYTSEFRNPGTDTFKAIFYSGLLCIALYILVPFTFQGALGLTGMLDPSIAAGSGVAKAMADMVGGNGLINGVMQLLMILALILSIMTAMAGSSRTLYQGSVDGWLPKYLTFVNSHGAPTRAMWTDLVFNLFLLAVASADATSFFFILAISNVGYIIFNFLNLNAGWIHRMDSGMTNRPYKAPTWLLGLGAVFAFVNATFMGAGAKTWNPMALWAGLIVAALILPVFCFRHYYQDKGKFPEQMLEDLHVGGSGDTTTKKAGILPYLTLAGGVIVVLASNWFFHL
jgi:amino acid transporter